MRISRFLMNYVMSSKPNPHAFIARKMTATPKKSHKHTQLPKATWDTTLFPTSNLFTHKQKATFFHNLKNIV